MEPLSDLSVEYFATASAKIFALLKDNLLLSCVNAKLTLISAAMLSITGSYYAAKGNLG
jgi:hypothetical protein